MSRAKSMFAVVGRVVVRRAADTPQQELLGHLGCERMAVTRGNTCQHQVDGGSAAGAGDAARTLGPLQMAAVTYRIAFGRRADRHLVPSTTAQEQADRKVECRDPVFKSLPLFSEAGIQN